MSRDAGMRRLEKFAISHKPIALKRNGLTAYESSNTVWLDAVWFRRRNGVTVACLGHLWDHMDQVPADFEEFARRCTTGRYGPDCMARWDGIHYWGSQQPGKMYADLELLRPMLENYPEVPDGYDGWWTFHV